MGKKDPPDGSGGNPPPSGAGRMTFDTTKKLTNESPGQKFLVMQRCGKNPSLEGVSPFLVKKCVEGIAQGPVEKLSWSRNGTILIKPKDLKQARQLIRLSGLNSEVKVEMLEHSRLNFAKGVVYNRMR